MPFCVLYKIFSYLCTIINHLTIYRNAKNENKCRCKEAFHFHRHR